MSLAADEVERRETRRRSQVDWERRNRRRWTLVGIGLVVGGVVGPIVGAWNPWNLVVVDRLLDHPSIGAAVVLVGLVVLWQVRGPGRPWLRNAGFGALGLLAVVWVVVTAMLVISRPDTIESQAFFSEHDDDIEVRVIDAKYDLGKEIWQVWLYAHRGLASRENHVAVLDVVEDDAPGRLPAFMTARFPAPDKLEVLVNDEVSYELTFDPDTLAVRDERCTPVPAAEGWNLTISCTTDLPELRI